MHKRRITFVQAEYIVEKDSICLLIALVNTKKYFLWQVMEKLSVITFLSQIFGQPMSIIIISLSISYRKEKRTVQRVGIYPFGKMFLSAAEHLKLPNSKEYRGHCSAALTVDANVDFTSLKRLGVWKQVL